MHAMSKDLSVPTVMIKYLRPWKSESKDHEP